MAKEARELPAQAPEGPGAPGPPSKHPGERACTICGVKLSLYNPGPHCWQHTVGWPWRGPSAKPRY
jgi:hypothetical protein